MLTLDAGNVLLKPSQRRQLMTCLRRSLRLGQRLGNFLLSITMHRVGRQYQLIATVKDRVGQFQCRCRAREFGDAIRDMARAVTRNLHDQHLRAMAVA
jgi:hypothetical protein